MREKLPTAHLHRRVVDALYVDAMLLADEARSYFEEEGRSERVGELAVVHGYSASGIRCRCGGSVSVGGGGLDYCDMFRLQVRGVSVGVRFFQDAVPIHGRLRGAIGI